MSNVFISLLMFFLVSHYVDKRWDIKDKGAIFKLSVGFSKGVFLCAIILLVNAITGELKFERIAQFYWVGAAVCVGLALFELLGKENYID